MLQLEFHTPGRPHPHNRYCLSVDGYFIDSGDQIMLIIQICLSWRGSVLALTGPRRSSQLLCHFCSLVSARYEFSTLCYSIYAFVIDVDTCNFILVLAMHLRYILCSKLWLFLRALYF